MVYEDGTNLFQHPDYLGRSLRSMTLYSVFWKYICAGILVGIEIITLPRLLPPVIVERVVLPRASLDLIDWRKAVATVALLQLDLQLWLAVSPISTSPTRSD